MRHMITKRSDRTFDLRFFLCLVRQITRLVTRHLNFFETYSSTPIIITRGGRKFPCRIKAGRSFTQAMRIVTINWSCRSLYVLSLVCSFRITGVRGVFRALISVRSCVFFYIFLRGGFIVPLFVLAFTPTVNSRSPHTTVKVKISYSWGKVK